MPFIVARCPSCAGDIQLDDTHEYGYCSYCGSKVLYKEDVQKVIHAGTVLLNTNIEPLLKSADGFLALGEKDRAYKIYKEVVTHDSTDYRGWWGLFLIDIGNFDMDRHFDNINNKFFSEVLQSDYYKKGDNVVLEEIFHMEDNGSPPTGIIDNAFKAIKVAPENKKRELDSKLSDWLNLYRKRLLAARRFCEERVIAQKKQFEEDQVKEDKIVGTFLLLTSTPGLVVGIVALGSSVPASEFLILFCVFLFVVAVVKLRKGLRK